jgi:hypothetical protein
MHTRDEAWRSLDDNFKAFMDCLGQLTEEELTSTCVVGIWTVKDTVAHVWSWTDEAVHTARAWQGPRSWQHDVKYDDAWNEAQVADKSALPLISVVDGATGAHRRLMHLLDITDDEALAQMGRAPWGDEMALADFFYEMGSHSLTHIDDLKNYQERCLEGCD